MIGERVHLGWGEVTVTDVVDGRISLTGRSVMGLAEEVTVRGILPLDLVKWLHGTYIQDAMPYLSADDREFLVSGISPVEWERMFGDEEGTVPSDDLGGEG